MVLIYSSKLASKLAISIPNTFIRSMSSTIKLENLPKHRALMIEKFGDPLECVKLQTSDARDIFPNELKNNQVLVQHLAAPVNPADINIIQGVYGVKPELPTVLGNEGVGKVLSVGSNVKKLKEGDHFIFSSSFSRTWQSHSIVTDDQLYPVDRKLDLTIAAQLKVNPCTAYFMLKNYANLKPNDVFIQNGANSACGVYVIQLAKAWGLKSINVIRDRPDKEEVVKELTDYGADVVLTESEISKIEVTQLVVKKFGKAKLALNCVGGKNASDCSKLLADNSYFVTYGAMSKKRVELSAAHIFKNIKYYPHWTSRAIDDLSKSKPYELATMLEELSKMFVEGNLKSKPTTQIGLSEYKTAFEAMTRGGSNTKYILML